MIKKLIHVIYLDLYYKNARLKSKTCIIIYSSFNNLFKYCSILSQFKWKTLNFYQDISRFIFIWRFKVIYNYKGIENILKNTCSFMLQFTWIYCYKVTKEIQILYMKIKLLFLLQNSPNAAHFSSTILIHNSPFFLV